ncbi:MAG: protein kinase [Bryobacterales bacterium]|nr:protein kinase [Bryobacterales bacterium]
MTPERWQRIEVLYERALAREPAEREPYLAEACGEDHELRREVESLLGHAQGADDFLEKPALEVAARQYVSAVTEDLTGRNLGRYEVLGRLGRGGMGEVYRARDSKLKRQVALKVLPPESVADPGRRRRFEQEARAASALHHPHIVTIHDIDQVDGVVFIAMEYVEGRTLAQRIGRKGLPLREVIEYAIQIADGLVAAHRAGIVHRDLKPANVMVGADGAVKVLDFGLAKLIERPAPGESDSTATLRAETEAGAIVGTVAYMSPEQAEGKSVDARSDIFSFGSVLYEMVSGKRAFQGDSSVSTLAAIIEKEPPPLAPEVPPDLAKLIRRCQRKQPERRIQHMDDVKLALEDLKEELESGSPAGPAQKPPRRVGPFVYAAALLVIIVAAALLWHFRPAPPARETARPAVPLTSAPGIEMSASFSPDGNEVVYAWNGEKQDSFDIYRKRIGGGKPLRLTFDPARDFAPAWAPDGEHIAFLRDLGGGRASVLLVPALGGPERKLAEIQAPGWVLWGAYARGRLDWSPDSTWLVTSDQPSASEPPALFLVSVESGEKRQITTPSALAMFTGDGSPAFSPDGRSLTFARGLSLYLLSLSKALSPQGEPRRLTSPEWRLAANYPVWTPDSGNILFVGGEGGVWKIAASGSAVPVKLSVGEFGNQPALSRDGRRLVYTRGSWDPDIWRLELSRPGSPAGPPARLIASTAVDSCPRYSPDGRKIAFASARSGFYEIWICDADGSNLIQLTHFKGDLVGTPRWSPDGNRIAFDVLLDGQYDILAVSVGGGKPRRITDNPAQDDNPSWSGDGKWIYFASNRTGESQVWRAPAGGGEPIQVTKRGGDAAFESTGGKFLYYAKAPFSTGYSRMSLWKLALSGGGETPVIEEPLLRTYDFALVDEGVYFGSEVAEGYALQFFNFADGKIKRVITSADNAFGRLGASHDGRWLLYDRYNLLGSNLMLAENFQ